jgi:hypothetical protein
MDQDAKARAEQMPKEGGQPIPPMRADDHSDADPAVQTPVEARQGFLGRPVLMVLVWGLVLAAAAWVVVELVA